VRRWLLCLVIALVAGAVSAATFASPVRHRAQAKSVALSLVVSQRYVVPGDRVTFVGRIARPGRGRRVFLQKRSGHAWKTLISERPVGGFVDFARNLRTLGPLSFRAALGGEGAGRSRAARSCSWSEYRRKKRLWQERVAGPRLGLPGWVS
jgi:hypothetical protein